MKRIALTQSQWACVSNRDYSRLIRNYTTWCAKWRPNTQTFEAIGRQKYGCKKGKQILMHRAVLQAQRGSKVDHIDHDSLNNQRSNLRIATSSQNQFNRCSPPRHNTSGIAGVMRSSNGKGWVAFINKHYKRHWLGTFPTKGAATTSRKLAERRLYGRFACRGKEKVT